MTEEIKRGRKPKVQEEMSKIDQQLSAYEEKVKNLSLDEMNKAPREEKEAQTKLSAREIEKSAEIYLKPDRKIMAINNRTGEAQKFNEKFRAAYEFAKEYVCFIAENHEIIGETIEVWTRPFGGLPAEFWKVPVNKPVWGPRYLAEQLTKCTYHRIIMNQDKIVAQDGNAVYNGAIEVKETRERVSARPAKLEKSVFMGASGF